MHQSVKKNNNNLIFSLIDSKNCVVIYDDFKYLPKVSLQKQVWLLKEDLLQLKFNKYIIDLGWYPEFNVEGSFHIVVIKNNNWDNPSYKKTCSDIKQVPGLLQAAIDYVHILLCQKAPA